MYGLYRYYPTRQEKNEINIIGGSTEIAIPDIAIVNIDLITKGEEPLKTERFHGKKLDRLLSLLKEFGIQRKDIKVQKEILTPIFDEDGRVKEYRAVTFVSITLYDLSAMSEFYYNMRGSDINISQIILMLQDMDKYYYKALEKAIENAFDKAKIIARSLGVDISDVPAVLNETSDMKDIISEVIITQGEQVQDIKLHTIVIPATVEAKFLVQ